MGNYSSTPSLPHKATSAQIKDNIKNLFPKKQDTYFPETIGYRESPTERVPLPRNDAQGEAPVQPTTVKPLSGGYQSRRNRYTDFDINQIIQDGGMVTESDTHSLSPNIAEFGKVKELLDNEITKGKNEAAAAPFPTNLSGGGDDKHKEKKKKSRKSSSTSQTSDTSSSDEKSEKKTFSGTSETGLNLLPFFSSESGTEYVKHAKN